MKRISKISLHPLSVADDKKQKASGDIPHKRISLFGCNTKTLVHRLAENKADEFRVNDYVIYEVCKKSTDQAAKDMYAKHKYVFAFSYIVNNLKDI
jgi:hypothetical protein